MVFLVPIFKIIFLFSQSALAGIASGILGLTGTYGFLFYVLTVLIQVCFNVYELINFC
jgi:hypothetical protein